MLYPPSTQDYPHLYTQIFSMVRVIESTRDSKGNNPRSLFPPLWTDIDILLGSTFLPFVQWHQSNTCCSLYKCMLSVCPRKFSSSEKEQNFDTRREMSRSHNRQSRWRSCWSFLENKMWCPIATTYAALHCSPSTQYYAPVSGIKRRIRVTFGK